MNKKQKLEVNLFQSIEQVCSIKCSKCNNTDNYFGADAYDILDELIMQGWNESPSKSWSFPIKKLSQQQLDKYLNHNKNYEEYYGIQ
jgi:hypothetical protein